jgi:hypothetical protein
MLTRLQDLEELAAKLLATARKLPPGPSRHNALQLIGRFRVQLICNAPICQYIRGRRRREHGGPSPATEAEYRAFFAAAIEAHADAIIVGDTAENFSKAQLIAELASARRLPAAYTNGEYVNVGGLLSYGYEISDSYRRATGAERELFIRKSNSCVVCVRLMAKDRGGICLDNFDWWSLNPDWSVVDEQVRRLAPPHIDGPSLVPDLWQRW